MNFSELPIPIWAQLQVRLAFSILGLLIITSQSISQREARYIWVMSLVERQTGIQLLPDHPFVIRDVHPELRCMARFAEYPHLLKLQSEDLVTVRQARLNVGLMLHQIVFSILLRSPEQWRLDDGYWMQYLVVEYLLAAMMDITTSPRQQWGKLHDPVELLDVIILQTACYVYNKYGAETEIADSMLAWMLERAFRHSPVVELFTELFDPSMRGWTSDELRALAASDQSSPNNQRISKFYASVGLFLLFKGARQWESKGVLVLDLAIRELQTAISVSGSAKGQEPLSLLQLLLVGRRIRIALSMPDGSVTPLTGTWTPDGWDELVELSKDLYARIGDASIIYSWRLFLLRQWVSRYHQDTVGGSMLYGAVHIIDATYIENPVSLPSKQASDFYFLAASVYLAKVDDPRICEETDVESSDNLLDMSRQLDVGQSVFTSQVHTHFQALLLAAQWRSSRCGGGLQKLDEAIGLLTSSLSDVETSLHESSRMALAPTLLDLLKERFEITGTENDRKEILRIHELFEAWALEKQTSMSSKAYLESLLAEGQLNPAFAGDLPYSATVSPALYETSSGASTIASRPLQAAIIYRGLATLNHNDIQHLESFFHRHLVDFPKWHWRWRDAAFIAMFAPLPTVPRANAGPFDTKHRHYQSDGNETLLLDVWHSMGFSTCTSVAEITAYLDRTFAGAHDTFVSVADHKMAKLYIVTGFYFLERPPHMWEAARKALKLALRADSSGSTSTLLALLVNTYSLVESHRHREESSERHFIDQAVELASETAQLLVHDRWSFVRVFGHLLLGRTLQLRFKDFGQPEDAQRALEAFEEIPRRRVASSWSVLGLSHAAAILYEIGKPLQDVYAKILQAVDKLEDAISGSYHVVDQYGTLAMLSVDDIAAFATSMALRLGKEPTEALLLHERASGLIISQRLEMRRDAELLASVGHADHLEALERLLDEMEKASRAPKDLIHEALFRSGEAMHRLQAERRNLLKKMRQLSPELPMLSGVTSKDLLPAVRKVGMIVLFNVSTAGSDAILIKGDGSVSRVNLPEFSTSEVEINVTRWRQAMRLRGSGDVHTARREVEDTLSWLWNSAISIVLEKLDILQSPSDRRSSLPRVCWIASGLVKQLPIHAAGQNGISTMDYTISSYVPSIRALLYAIERTEIVAKASPSNEKQSLRRQSLLFVGMSTTPAMPDLPAVGLEMQAVMALNGVDLTLSLSLPTEGSSTAVMAHKKEILQRLSNHDFFHFSGHCEVSPDPTDSKILLQDWQREPLYVGDIAAQHFQCAQFACLAGCQTATTNLTDKGILDEAIHLSSAMLLAGFPSVVGSMWEIMDGPTALLTRLLYHYMRNDDYGNEIGRLNHVKSAEALHKAMCVIRNVSRAQLAGLPLAVAFRGSDSLRSMPCDPLVWAPYIHLGV